MSKNVPHYSEIILWVKYKQHYCIHMDFFHYRFHFWEDILDHCQNEWGLRGGKRIQTCLMAARRLYVSVVTTDPITEPSRPSRIPYLALISKPFKASLMLKNNGAKEEGGTVPSFPPKLLTLLHSWSMCLNKSIRTHDTNLCGSLHLILTASR